METIAAVPSREPLYVGEIKHDGVSRIDRLLQLRVGLRSVLIREGILDVNGGYTQKGHGREGIMHYMCIQIGLDGPIYRGEVAEVGERVPIHVFLVA
jgi:hypothetical protein